VEGRAKDQDLVKGQSPCHPREDQDLVDREDLDPAAEDREETVEATEEATEEERWLPETVPTGLFSFAPRLEEAARAEPSRSVL
jgi:hypothetical protein